MTVFSKTTDLEFPNSFSVYLLTCLEIDPSLAPS